MAESEERSVLKRMAAAGRGHGAAPPTPARAFGLGAAKATQDLFGLAVSVTSTGEIRASLAELPERLPERALIAVMGGPGEGLGLVALSQEVLATLIEVQTTGRVGAAEVAFRRPTRTDAAMSLRFIERVEEELEVLLAADPAIAWAGGFRYATFLDDPRPLGVLFDDAGYRLLRLTLGFGEAGARSGTVMLAVSAEGRGAPPPPAAEPEAGTVGTRVAAAEWSERMEQAVLGAEVMLDAVLDRMRLPLAEVATWEPGTIVPLAAGAAVRIRIEGHGRRRVASGRLGQFQGHLAVRLDPARRGDGGTLAGAVDSDGQFDPSAAPQVVIASARGAATPEVARGNGARKAAGGEPGPDTVASPR